jgi:cytochrome c-type biogenesis protein CcmH/NrfG
VQKRHPFDLASGKRLGLALNRLGRHVHAVSVWREITDEFPGDPSHWTNLGISEMGAGRVLGAVRSFEEARRLSPNDPAVLTNLGKAYLEEAEVLKYERESLIKAEAAFARALELDPGNLGAKLGRARTLVRLNPGDNDLAQAAKVLYEETLASDPENFEALLNVALLYYDLRLGAGSERGEWYWKALEYFRKAEALRPASEWDRGARNAYDDLKKM